MRGKWFFCMGLLKRLRKLLRKTESLLRKGQKKFGKDNMKQQNKHIGSNFDDFLKEEGILEEIEEVVAKRIFVFQIEKEMKKQKIDKAGLAERMETSRSAVDRILDPE